MNTFQEQQFIVHMWIYSRSCLGMRDGLSRTCANSASRHLRIGTGTVQTQPDTGHNKGNFYSDEHW